MLAGVAFAAIPARAPATPFADVPGGNWAYQAIQSLSADGLIDGYPDGSFNGDRALTRYEMAAIVARIIAKIQADGAGTASRSDLDKLQKLIDALKDELDALGVRVTSLEDALAALDRRTRTAQALAVHGTVRAGASFRSLPGVPRSSDPFVNAYETAPDNDDPLEAQLAPQTILRSDARFDFVYTVDDNVTVSVPVHVVENGWSSAGNQQLALSPDVVVDIAQAGAFTNVSLREAKLDNLASSRLGLAYRAPDAAQTFDYQNATQPFPRGFEIGGILSGLTTFQLAFSQVDQTWINTQGLPSAGGYAAPYLANVVPPQGGFVQSGSAATTDTFGSGASELPGVFLSKKAVAGTVAIVAYSTAAGPAAPPAFSYLDGTNEVVFATPLPPGAHISIAYLGLGYTNNAVPQRFQLGLRVNTLLAGLPGGEFGLTYHRLWDENLPQSTDPAAVDLGANAFPAGGTGAGAVSDEVFGLDFQLPLAFARGASATPPLLFAEGAGSRYTPDAQFIAATGGTAAVAGLKFALHGAQLTLQMQYVGANYFDGAPLRFFGNVPPAWANTRGTFFPQFFGFASTLGINAAFDAAVAGAGGASTSAANPALTFIAPVFNPFVAGGPQYDSAFAPNTTGPSLTVLSPLRFGNLIVAGRLFAQHLSQLQADAGSTATFGPQFPTAVRATFDKLDAGATFGLPAFGRTLDVNLAGTLEHLRRNDPTGYLYVPYDPAAGAYDAAALASFEAAGGTVDASTGKILSAGAAAVLFAPNNVNLYHTSLAAGASLPLTPDVVLRTRYSGQRYTGASGIVSGSNVNGTKDQIDVGLTYTVPKTASSVGLTFRNSTYKDGTLSGYNLSENREDVNFTIRF